MYFWNPLDTESMSAMPMIPMLPAKAVSRVLAFLVMRLFSDSCSAVFIDIDLLCLPLALLAARFGTSAASAPASPAAAPAAGRAPALSITGSVPGTNGSESLMTCPSDSLTILVEYSSASSGLCVTIMTSLFLDISFRMAITWMLVSESSAPVGSSARIMSGSFMSARAIATLCTCPPDICAGFLYIWSPRPTCSRACIALCFLSPADTPERVSASSTLASTVWCEIRL